VAAFVSAGAPYAWVCGRTFSASATGDPLVIPRRPGFGGSRLQPCRGTAKGVHALQLLAAVFHQHPCVLLRLATRPGDPRQAPPTHARYTACADSETRTHPKVAAAVVMLSLWVVGWARVAPARSPQSVTLEGSRRGLGSRLAAGAPGDGVAGTARLARPATRSRASIAGCVGPRVLMDHVASQFKHVERFLTWRPRESTLITHSGMRPGALCVTSFITPRVAQVRRPNPG
jgi:hypothetical protein